MSVSPTQRDIYQRERHRLDLFPRFRDKVHFGWHCWEWRGARDDKGYGKFGIGGRMYRAHRVAMILCGVKLPHPGAEPRMVVDHECNNPSCVRPSHLRVVPHRVNIMRSGMMGSDSHCVHGHKLDARNLGVHRRTTGKSDHRYCKACSRERRARRRLEQSQQG